MNTGESSKRPTEDKMSDEAAPLSADGFGGSRYSASKKRGCPTCDGIDPKSCMRCGGRTRLCDWINTDTGWTPNAELTGRDTES